jgi:uncharacterized protein DUF3703
MSRFAQRIHTSVQSELDAASQAEARGDTGLAFHHLERAHVLGQASTVEHVRAHWRMFLWATRHRKVREAVVQLWRLPAAALLTGIGLVPTGNTGGANVSSIRRMPVPRELQRVIELAHR